MTSQLRKKRRTIRSKGLAIRHSAGNEFQHGQETIGRWPTQSNHRWFSAISSAAIFPMVICLAVVSILPNQATAQQQGFFQPPVHASPVAGTVVSPRQASNQNNTQRAPVLPPVRRPGFPGAFKRAQLSSDHLFGPKGPSLQDKITNMFTRDREPSPAQAPAPNTQDQATQMQLAAQHEARNRQQYEAQQQYQAQQYQAQQQQYQAGQTQPMQQPNVQFGLSGNTQQLAPQQLASPQSTVASSQQSLQTQSRPATVPEYINPTSEPAATSTDSFQQYKAMVTEYSSRDAETGQVAPVEVSSAKAKVVSAEEEHRQRAERFEQQMSILAQSSEFKTNAVGAHEQTRSPLPPATLDPTVEKSTMRSLLATEEMPATYRRTPADYEQLMNASRRGSQVMKTAAQEEFGRPIRTAGVTPVQDPFNDRFRTPTPTSRPQSVPARGASVITENEDAYSVAPRRQPRANWQDEDDVFGQESGRLPEPRLPRNLDNPIRDDQERGVDDLRKELDKIEQEEGERPFDLSPPDEDEDNPLDDEEDDEDFQAPIQKSCDEFRGELLGSSIRDISLDISPPQATTGENYVAISRSWTDRNGNILATGTMTDLRRGYVILESGQKLAYARLSDADLAAVSDAWRIPAECTLGPQPFYGRNWVPQTYQWTASNLCHKPLYFENVQLERYGHSAGPFIQPIRSANHFFASLFLLPNQMATRSPTECEYALGYYRPGNCAPWLVNEMSYSLNGLRTQALFLTGAAFIP